MQISLELVEWKGRKLSFTTRLSGRASGYATTSVIKVRLTVLRVVMRKVCHWPNLPLSMLHAKQGEATDLGRQPDRALDSKVLVLGTVDQISADCTMTRLSQHLACNGRRRSAPFSRFLTLREVKVMRILCAWAGTPPAGS